MKTVGYFLVCSLLFWALAVVPSRYVWGDSAAAFSAAAMLLCAAPSAFNIALSSWAGRNCPDKQMLCFLVGSAVRMLIAGGAALVLYFMVPYFQEQTAFLIWLMVCYLFTLILEKALVLKSMPTSMKAV